MNYLLNSVFLSLFFLIIVRPARAYLDPGSGSFILQMILGAFLGGLFTIKVYSRKVKSFILKISGRTKSEDKHDGKNK